METRFLVGSAVSGGSLRELLESAAKACGAGRIVFGVESVAMDFPLPCPSGVGVRLAPSELEALRRQCGAPVYFSEALCAKYFTCRRNGRAHFILFDDEETLRCKQELARSLGIREILRLYPGML